MKRVHDKSVEKDVKVTSVNDSRIRSLGNVTFAKHYDAIKITLIESSKDVDVQEIDSDLESMLDDE
ncbi:hypothetical protein Tco_0306670, partial [Tanacetum coccineum]